MVQIKQWLRNKRCWPLIKHFDNFITLLSIYIIIIITIKKCCSLLPFKPPVYYNLIVLETYFIIS